MARIGINGFGRIGRAVLRAILARPELGKKLEVVAVNDLTDAPTLAHLLRYDSVHGKLDHSVEVGDGGFKVDGRPIRVLSQREVNRLPWRELEVPIVIEATGHVTRKTEAQGHLSAGAQKVIITAPASEPDVTLALGVNDESYDSARHHVISNASCTTNCLAPVAKVLDEQFGLVRGWMTTTHAYTNDQRILDLPHSDLRRARAAALSMIPTTTGAARAVGLVLPQLKGRLDGIAIRVPTADVSVVDLVAELGQQTDANQINEAFRKAAQGPLKGILRLSEEPLVSIDFLGDAHSSVVDTEYTRVLDGKLVKVLAWYDNEWGYANRVAELAALVAAKL
jgi:glyceraldehyde 3-phosphate dehydrogenase